MALSLISGAKRAVAASATPLRRKAARGLRTLDSRPGLAAPSPLVHAISPSITPVIQPKLRIGEPNDKYEQEADRVTNAVMRMPDSDVGPISDIGEAAEGTPALSAKIRALRGSGQQLPPSARAFFEPRFGVDFRSVRMHADGQAAQLAQAMNARAFAVGRHVVFGAGRYAPNTRAGRELLAHELTHVAQQVVALHQMGPARIPSRPSSESEFIQRSPDKRMVAQRGWEPRLRELAKWPADAHRAWKKLNAVDRALVLWQMAANYGDHFAQEFLEYTRSRPRFTSRHYDSRISWVAPQWLRERGYRWVLTDLLNHWWVHPSGMVITKGVEGRASLKRPEPAPEEAPPSGIAIEGSEDWPARLDPTGDWPARLDPNADREALFGPIVAVRENADIDFGTGDVLLYEDGAVELFVEGTTTSYVFRPILGGGYVVYGPDGRRLEAIWMIPEEDIPDPVADAVP